MMKIKDEQSYPISIRSKNTSNFSCGDGNLSAKSCALYTLRAKLPRCSMSKRTRATQRQQQIVNRAAQQQRRKHLLAQQQLKLGERQSLSVQ